MGCQQRGKWVGNIGGADSNSWIMGSRCHCDCEVMTAAAMTIGQFGFQSTALSFNKNCSHHLKPTGMRNCVWYQKETRVCKYDLEKDWNWNPWAIGNSNSVRKTCLCLGFTCLGSVSSLSAQTKGWAYKNNKWKIICWTQSLQVLYARSFETVLFAYLAYLILSLAFQHTPASLLSLLPTLDLSTESPSQQGWKFYKIPTRIYTPWLEHSAAASLLQQGVLTSRVGKSFNTRFMMTPSHWPHGCKAKTGSCELHDSETTSEITTVPRCRLREETHLRWAWPLRIRAKLLRLGSYSVPISPQSVHVGGRHWNT